MPTRTTSIFLVSATAIAASGAAWLMFSIQPSTTKAGPVAMNPTASMQVAVSPHQLRLALQRVGLDAKGLTAGGVTNVEEVTTLINSVESVLTSNPNAVANADASAGTAAQNVADLEHRIQSGTGTQEDVTALEAARNALAAANTAREGLLNDLFSAAVFQLSEPQESLLSVERANRATWALPIEFLVINHSEVEWVTLRDALAHERIALAQGEPVLPAVQAYLAEARAVPAVAAAISNLATHGAAVQAAWDLATAN